jgi:hypothetical protein
MVTLRENLRMPRFPDRADGEPRDSAANAAARARADQLVSAIQDFRTPGYNALAKVFAARYGATEKERLWLINAMKVQMFLSKVRELAARDDVQYVGYTQAGSPPSDPARPGTDISDGRARIQSDPYYGYHDSWIGMLDTGTRPHILNNDGASYIRDCIRGIADYCQTGENLQPTEVGNDHGTGSMSILFGTNDLGNPSRGVTDIVVDSWKVCEGGYDDAGCVVDAGARALLAAVASQDKVIMVNMQADEPEWGGLSRAADQAFDAGSVVVAAAGNFGNTDGANCTGDPIWGSVTAPGNAHKALAVGAVYVDTLLMFNCSGRGPANDGRTKPDVLAPTDAWVASASGYTNMHHLSRTSGATPFAAGAAALFRSFLKTFMDPGRARGSRGSRRVFVAGGAVRYSQRLAHDSSVSGRRADLERGAGPAAGSCEERSSC